MSKVQFVLFHLTLLTIVHRSPGLIQMPPVESNLILDTEAAVRSTMNEIFYMMKLKKFKEKPRMKRYGILHNYFTSVTLKDYNGLREVAELTRADNKNIDNTTLSFIAMINSILNADNFSDAEENSTRFHESISEDAANYLESYLKQLNYYENVVVNGPRVDVNEEVSKILTNIKIEDLNITEPKYNTSDEDNEDINNVLDTNEFWRPTNQESRRIYGGHKTHIRYFPFIAAVLVFGVFQCAGSIVHSDLVLTAASCLQLAYNNRFYRERPSFLSVRVGSNFFDGAGELIPVIEVYFHPAYNPRTLQHNLALLRLQRILKLTTPKVKKIAIDREAGPLPTNTNGITLLGWGAKTQANVMTNGWQDNLKYIILDVFDLQDCMKIYSREYVTFKHFCAGFISKGGGACHRDVGAPGVAAGILRGVVSFGSPQCGTANTPTVFTKIGYYADWIDSIRDQQDVPRGRQQSSIGVSPWEKTTPSTKYRQHQTVDMKPINTVDHPLNIITPTPSVPWVIPMDPTEGPSGITQLPLEVLDQPFTTNQPIARQGKKRNMQLFNEFLRTMFNSREIDDYINQFVDERSKLQESRQYTERVVWTDETMAPRQYSTQNENFEAESIDINDYETMTTPRMIYKPILGNLNDYTDVIRTGGDIEAQMAVQKDRAELINIANMRQILKEGTTMDPPPTKNSKPKHNNVKKLVKNKIKKTNSAKSRQSNVYQTSYTKDTFRENDGIHTKADIDNNIEPGKALLYLTDGETESNEAVDIENLVHNDDEDTVEIAKKLESIQAILPDIPEIPELPVIPEIPEAYEQRTDVNMRANNKLDQLAKSALIELDRFAKSNYVSKKLIVDILNDMIMSEPKLTD